MDKQDWHSAEKAADVDWLYPLIGYIIGFVVAHMLARRAAIGRKTGAFVGGLGVALSGRSLGNPWRP